MASREVRTGHDATDQPIKPSQECRCEHRCSRSCQSAVQREFHGPPWSNDVSRDAGRLGMQPFRHMASPAAILDLNASTSRERPPSGGQSEISSTQASAVTDTLGDVLARHQPPVGCARMVGDQSTRPPAVRMSNRALGWRVAGQSSESSALSDAGVMSSISLHHQTLETHREAVASSQLSYQIVETHRGPCAA